MGTPWVAEGIPPENSCLVRTVYVIIHHKDRFPGVMTKPWAFETMSGPTFTTVLFFLMWANDYLSFLEDDPGGHSLQ